MNRWVGVGNQQNADRETWLHNITSCQLFLSQLLGKIRWCCLWKLKLMDLENLNKSPEVKSLWEGNPLVIAQENNDLKKLPSNEHVVLERGIQQNLNLKNVSA